MVTPAVVWIGVAALSLAILVMTLAGPERHDAGETAKARHGRRNARLFSLGSEREVLFVPGDPLNGQFDDNDE